MGNENWSETWVGPDIQWTYTALISICLVHKWWELSYWNWQTTGRRKQKYGHDLSVQFLWRCGHTACTFQRFWEENENWCMEDSINFERPFQMLQWHSSGFCRETFMLEVGAILGPYFFDILEAKSFTNVLHEIIMDSPRLLGFWVVDCCALWTVQHI